MLDHVCGRMSSQRTRMNAESKDARVLGAWLDSGCVDRRGCVVVELVVAQGRLWRTSMEEATCMRTNPRLS